MGIYKLTFRGKTHVVSPSTFWAIALPALSLLAAVGIFSVYLWVLAVGVEGLLLFVFLFGRLTIGSNTLALLPQNIVVLWTGRACAWGVLAYGAYKFFWN